MATKKTCEGCGNAFSGSGEICITCKKRRRNQEAETEAPPAADPAGADRKDGRRASIRRRTSRRMSSSSQGTTSSSKVLETVFEAEEILKHTSRKSLWVVIEGFVYDVTAFQKQHPGGAAVLLQWAGRDATEAARTAHNGRTKPNQLMKEMVIGVFQGDVDDLMNQRTARPETTKMPMLDLSALNAAAGAVPYAAPPPPPVMSYEESVPTLTNVSTESTSEEGGVNEAASSFSVGAADVDVENFEELRLEPQVISETLRVWEAFLRTQGTKEHAGEAVYNALFEGAPSLQTLFTTPRAVQAMRFTTELHTLVNLIDQPKALKDAVESLGFGHLNLDVTVPRVVIFRDSILELFEIELGEELSELGKIGWLSLLNYIGGAVCYIKTFYHERLNVLDSSWKKATDPDYNKDRSRADASKAAQRRAQNSGEVESGELSGDAGEAYYEDIPKKSSSRFNRLFTRSGKATNRSDSNSNLAGGGDSHTEVSMGGIGNTIVVRTFQAMFDFNSAVMGLSSNQWLKEIVQSFDNIVTNISNTGRVQEECDVLVLKIATCTTGDIHLGDFKSCMLATLRSLLPKEWDSTHEVAWNWLWDNVERMIRASLGKPREWLRALRLMLEELDEVTKHQIRMRIYAKFFVVAQAGQDYFKQSDTRLHFIAERIIMMTVELFENPHRMVDDISALGLRHVGYGIPTELFNPFVSVSVEVLKEYTNNPRGNEAFSWSLNLISKMLVRTITEGSTIVMKAINANSVPQLKRALAVAPRAARSTWQLRVEAGTQNISPLMWSIESGRVETAEAIIQDLLTIRADRDRYYYGVEDLFNRHRDIIKRLLTDAPSLLPVLLQGLVWRSRIARDGMRRVNYYVKFLLINPEDNSVSETLSWLVAAKNPQTMSHEVVVLVSDTMWNGLIYRQFIYSKVWFIISLMFFMLGQAILPKSDSAGELPCRLGILFSRLLIYCVTMCRLLYTHSKFCLRAYREGETMTCLRCLKVPSYLRDPRDSGGFLLMLLLMMMCALEPLFYCLPEISDFPSYDCPAAESLSWEYSVFCMGAMAIHWLLLVDISVFSTGLSAFVLVIGQVLSEMTRFLITLVWLLLTFGSAISVLEHPYFEMRDIPNTAIALFSITIRLYEDDYRNMLAEPALLATVFVFVTASAVVLLNLLIAQINCSYVYIYQDMVGFARLNRADVICETLEKATAKTWLNFVDTLQLDVPLEFNEGDVGLAGGIQVLEPSGLHPVTEDSILRFGGSSALEMPWPEETGHHEDEDRYHRISKMLKSVLKNVGKSTKPKKAAVAAEVYNSQSSESVLSGSSLEQGSSSAHS